MKKRTFNKEFFKLYETVYRVMVKEFGKKRGYELWKAVIHEHLFTAFKEGNAKRLGGPKEFIRFMGLRDASLGLHVEYEVVPNGFILRSYTRLFPVLKGSLTPNQYMEALLTPKIEWFLGNLWKVKITKWSPKPNGCVEYLFKKSTK